MGAWQGVALHGQSCQLQFMASGAAGTPTRRCSPLDTLHKAGRSEECSGAHQHLPDQPGAGHTHALTVQTCYHRFVIEAGVCGV
jgi:hypothetical protein